MYIDSGIDFNAFFELTDLNAVKTDINNTNIFKPMSEPFKLVDDQHS